MNRAGALAGASLALAVALVACSDPVVGGVCAPGFRPVLGVGCVRDADALLAGDVADAGSLRDGAMGDDGATFTDGDARDAPKPDGHDLNDAADGGAGLDGGSGDGGFGDAQGVDAVVTSSDGAAGDGAAGDASCAPGTTACGGRCVDTNTSPTDCGACGRACVGGTRCSLGMCVLACTPPQIPCGMLCIDPNSDPQNCGGCGVVCSTGVCNAGRCRDGRAGHLVLIGHDYRRTRDDQDRILANAVFLRPGAPTRILAYSVYADNTVPMGAVVNATAAIGRYAFARPFVITMAPSGAAVSSMLSIDNYDCMLVYAQTQATDAQIRMLAAQLGPPLAGFARAGGAVVVLDGAGANAGTFPIAAETGLLAVTGAAAIDGATVSVTSPADAVAAGVSAAYRAESSSLRFTGGDPNVVFAQDGLPLTAPVVLHRAVLPGAR